MNNKAANKRLLIALFFGLICGILLSNQQIPFLHADSNTAIVPELNSYDPTGQQMYWEQVISYPRLERSWVPGGWLLVYKSGVDNISSTFYPDQNHEWQPKVKKGAPWGEQG
jgi:hypothetical protein